MIISRTPFRVSLFGGGSDLPAFYERDPTIPGVVLTSTIDKFIYVSVNKKFDGHIRVSYSTTENVTKVDEIQHDIVRELLKLLGIRGGIEITSVADIPGSGTGLGSSSSFAVGLAHVLYRYLGLQEDDGLCVSHRCLASLACKVEMEVLGKPIGKQDQYEAALGGFRKIKFWADGRVVATKLPFGVLRMLEKSCAMYYTNTTRDADTILKGQSEATAHDITKWRTLRVMRDQAEAMADRCLDGPQPTTEEFGHELLKTQINKASLSPSIMGGYDLEGHFRDAFERGAIGGKILGAGGGGFFLFIVPEDLMFSFKEKMKKLSRPMPELPFKFHNGGTEIIYED